jgi:GNAT superfamily N-acetyltransferase
MMEAYQPEGRHVPITADDPRYAAAVAGISVFGLRPEAGAYKCKIGQKHPLDRRLHVLRQLWLRGDPGDVAAIDTVRRLDPSLPEPDWLASPARLSVSPGAGDAADAAALLADAYWNVGIAQETLAEAQSRATAWVVARHEGRLVATARAISDGVKLCWVFDVCVAPGWRGRGLGDAVMRVLLDHPATRGAARVGLATRDAMGFYAKLGFVPKSEGAKRPYVVTEMVWDRNAARMGPVAGDGG